MGNNILTIITLLMMCTALFLSFVKNEEIASLSFCIFILISFLFGISGLSFYSTDNMLVFDTLLGLLSAACSICTGFITVLWVIRKKKTARILGGICAFIILFIQLKQMF